MMTDCKKTVFLPQTSFPMRGNLPVLEPTLVTSWEKANLYKKINLQKTKKYILHDGPPYANGPIHMGHALNKILKDVVLKTARKLGLEAPFVPGWDCHGLPIEWKIEEEVRREGKQKYEIPVLEFRARCRAYAERWIRHQIEDFKRLGILADWEKPYVTQDFSVEASIVEELYKCLHKGLVTQGVKPVMWSVVEETALAEAEVEYKDKVSPSIWVGFKVIEALDPDLVGAEAVIWTTTPWTLPGNRAIAYNPNETYSLVEIQGRCVILADDLVDPFLKKLNVQGTRIKTLKGNSLEGVLASHPWRGLGYDFPVPFLPGDHVTLEAGTGLVHTAPGHGVEDFALGQKFNLPIPETVGPDGRYLDSVPLWAGEHVYKVHDKIIESLGSAVWVKETITHSYPHSWRSKAPLIFRTTPQWFLKVGELRSQALSEIEKVQWIPPQGLARLSAMVENRPEWCISRQRSWGVPIAFFINRKSGEVLKDSEVERRVLEAFQKEGGDAWYKEDPRRFLQGLYPFEDFRPVMDTLDVWFDSGTTHAYVLGKDTRLAPKADLYLEGSDQHRGWFQSSLMTSVATIGQAPFKTVLTHGFVLDDHGHKMSKSMKNVVAPGDVIDRLGADVLRLWVIQSDFKEDLRIGEEVLRHTQESYRKYRNTLRYLLGALHGAQPEEMSYADLPSLEQFILHRLSVLNKQFSLLLENFDFQGFYRELAHFCATDLSAFYFDIRKDTLYCDSAQSPKRRATLYVMSKILSFLLHWLSPVLSFTTEEAFLDLGKEGSIHLGALPVIPREWHVPELEVQWAEIREVRRVITGALEVARMEGKIGSSLQAHIVLTIPSDRWLGLENIDMAELAITSGVDMVDGRRIQEGAFTLPEVESVSVQVRLASGEKCERCWKVTSDVGKNSTYLTLCERCVEVCTSLNEKDLI